MGRAFIENGIWREAAETACDAVVQQKATLRVSALAALITLGLYSGPELKLARSEFNEWSAPLVSQPEMVVYKPADRVPSLGDITSSATARRAPRFEPDAQARTTPVEQKPSAPIEILDAATLKAGDMTVRLSGLTLPAPESSCRRLDGLSVSCIDRAASYLQLLVKGRAVACDPTGKADDGTDLGRCRVGDTDIAEQMIRQGWARAAEASDKRLAVAEAAARVQKIGIWRE